MPVSLATLRSFVSSQHVQQLEKIHRTIPIRHREGRFVQMDQFQADLNTARRYERALTEWAKNRAYQEEKGRRATVQQAEQHVAELANEIAELYRGVGVDLRGQPTPQTLHKAWAEVSDRVDRHIKDQQNLGPTGSQRDEESLHQRGGVTVQHETDAIIDTARAIRERIPELEAATRQVSQLQDDVGVSPTEFDKRWCRWLESFEQIHGPIAHDPRDPDPRPTLPRDVEARLKEWGLGQSQE